jgi:catechol 2,3-dioxygenase-like lactoylglutathione lyase family enzyme
MKTCAVAPLFGCFLSAVTSTASAQLVAAKDGPIVYGHHHVNATNLEEHKKFWSTLGGTVVKIGTNQVEVLMFPNVLVFMRAQAPTGPTKGTTMNHIGFAVPNIRQMVDKVKAAGYPIVTREELPADQEVKDGLAFIANQKTSIAYTMGPDNNKVEFVENKALTMPIALHHIHFAGQHVDEMKAWYVKVFGAKPGVRGSFQAADLPGVNLTFSPSAEPVVGTQGRALDHIGFEVKELEAFCKKLEAMGIKLERPYTKVPALGIAIAFIKDPWGTYIELTEGLDKVT